LSSGSLIRTIRIFACIFHLTAQSDPSLTVLAIDREQLDRADRKALQAVAPVPTGSDWWALDATVKREVVRGARRVPTFGLGHARHDVPEIRFGSKERDCLYSVTSTSPLIHIESAQKIVLLTANTLPIAPHLAEVGLPEPAGVAEEFCGGIAWLLSIVADFCLGPDIVDVPIEENLLDCFDRVDVGGLNWDLDDPWWER
jgi:hypothetical protein